jgi:sulfur carrier protein ThiS adenylyltransferase
MNFDEIKKRLKQHTVGIAGAGGLGSNIAMHLTRVGIGKLIVADFDVVQESNLNRQFYFRHQLGTKKVEALEANLLTINPELHIEVHNIKLDAQGIAKIYGGVDVMVEAFDKAKMKEIIAEVFQSEYPNIPLVMGNGIAGWGKSNDMRVRQFGNLYICGDGVSEIADELPPLSPRVGICAAMQANVVLELLLGNK